MALFEKLVLKANAVLLPMASKNDSQEKDSSVTDARATPHMIGTRAAYTCAEKFWKMPENTCPARKSHAPAVTRAWVSNGAYPRCVFRKPAFAIGVYSTAHKKYVF